MRRKIGEGHSGEGKEHSEKTEAHDHRWSPVVKIARRPESPKDCNMHEGLADSRVFIAKLSTGIEAGRWLSRILTERIPRPLAKSHE